MFFVEHLKRKYVENERSNEMNYRKKGITNGELQLELCTIFQKERNVYFILGYKLHM